MVCPAQLKVQVSIVCFCWPGFYLRDKRVVSNPANGVDNSDGLIDTLARMTLSSAQLNTELEFSPELVSQRPWNFNSLSRDGPLSEALTTTLEVD